MIELIEALLGPLLIIGISLYLGGSFLLILAPDIAILIGAVIAIALVIGLSLLIASWIYEWLG